MLYETSKVFLCTHYTDREIENSVGDFCRISRLSLGKWEVNLGKSVLGEKKYREDFPGSGT